MKVNLSNSTHKKSYFPISLDSSSTCNFGEFLPLFCHELVPGSSVNLNVRDAVRFAPLSFPTFGKAFLKTYHFCHRVSDLFPPFENMLAQTEFTSQSGSTYIPSSVPSVPLWFLWLTVLSNCEFTLYSTKYNSFVSDGSVHPFISSNVPYNNCSSDLVALNSPSKFIDFTSLSASFPYLLLYSLTSSDTGLNRFNPIRNSDTQSLLSFFQNIAQMGNASDLVFFNSSASNIGSVCCTGADDPNGNLRAAVTPSSADFIFPVSLSAPSLFHLTQNNVNVSSSGGLSFQNQPDGYNKMFACIRLTDSGKFLRKVLLGLGYQLVPSDTYVSILPLFAYFKSYFNTFAPKRFVKFEQSFFSRLINDCVQNGTSLLQTVINVSSQGVFGWSDVVDDLLSCYYTKDTDYYSAQIIGLINDYGNGLTAPYMAQHNNTPNVSVDTLGHSTDTDNGLTPSINLSGNLAHTQSQQNILSRLTQFVNRRSVIGGKIASLLKSVFGIKSDDIEAYNSLVGSSSLDVNFSDVFSTAETSEGSLGEYAGKAMAFTDNSDSFTITSDDTFSILFSCSVIVPRTQYVQGVNPILNHVRNTDFYNPLYDGLTLLPTRKTSLFSNPLFLTSLDTTSFGNLPVFTEYKTKSCGVLNGDLSLRSTRSTYDSFTMDELISGTFLDSPDSDSSGNDKGNFTFAEYNFDSLVCGTMWRYLGRWLWLGRFDRIFVNNRLSFDSFYDSLVPTSIDHDLSSSRNIYRTDDNLICHHVIDLNINAPMIPTSGSFLTDDLYSLDPSGITVSSE